MPHSAAALRSGTRAHRDERTTRQHRFNFTTRANASSHRCLCRIHGAAIYFCLCPTRWGSSASLWDRVYRRITAEGLISLGRIMWQLLRVRGLTYTTTIDRFAHVFGIIVQIRVFQDRIRNYIVSNIREYWKIQNEEATRIKWLHIITGDEEEV